MISYKGNPLAAAKPAQKKSTHLKAEVFTGSFSDPEARFTKSNWMYHTNRSHSAVDERMKISGRLRIPPPDGYDPFAWWRPATVLEYFRAVFAYRIVPPIILLRFRGHPEFDWMRTSKN